MPTDAEPKTPPQSALADCAAAFLLLTRIPVIWHRFEDDTPPDFISAQWAFPLVGLIIGSIGGMVMVTAIALAMPAIVAASVALAVMVGLTGGMHEDGLADTLDGFGGGFDRERKAEIMHDSHIGSYGVTGLCLATIARVGLLVALTDFVGGWALVLIVAVSAAGARFQVMALLRLYPVSPLAKLAQMTGKPEPGRGIIGMALWVVPMVLFLPQLGVIAAIIVSIAISLGLGWLAMRQIGGLSGDVMGAAIILGDISILTSLIAAMRVGAGS